MSNKQNKIISRLLALAKQSELNQKHAAAIVCGGKLVTANVNNHRSKYGSEIRCSGHSEVACIHHLFPEAFRKRKKGWCVL